MSSSSWWSSSEDLQETNKRLDKSAKSSLRWLAFALEVLGWMLVAGITIYLRFANLQPDISGLNWKMLCQDVTLFAQKPDSDNKTLLYVLVIVIPIVFVIIGEIEYPLLSQRSYFNNMGKCNKIIRNMPRTGRIVAMFILGMMLSSFSCDYLKILILEPRPYFLTQYGSNCPSAFNGTKTEEFYTTLKSFPSHLASVAGFCCMFAIGYAHRVHAAYSRPVLMPVMSQGFLVLGATVSLARYTNHSSHLSDIVAGLLIGLFFGLYMCSLVTSTLKLRVPGQPRQWPNFLDYMIPRVALPPTLTAEATNNVRALKEPPPPNV